MSDTTELAEHEAAAAEAEEETPDEDELDEPADEPVDEQTPPATGEPSKAQLREFDAEQERHEQELRRIMGAYVEGFVACDHCSGIGLVPPSPQPRTHPWFVACRTCAGYGNVLTGSLDPGHESVACPECGGRGYLEAVNSAGTPLAEVAKAAGGLPPLAPSSAAELADAGANGHTGGELEPAGFARPTWMGDPSLGGS